MTLVIRRFPMLAAVLALMAVCGCMLFPKLEVGEQAISFGTTSTVEKLTILNTGGGTLTWRIEEVVRANEDAPWVTQDVPWLSVETVSGATKSSAVVRLLAVRGGQPVGAYRNTGIRIVSNGGTVTVHVSITIPATLTVNPPSLAMSPGTTSAQFSVINSGAQQAAWSVRYLPDVNLPTQSQDLPSDIVVSPNPGQTGPGQTTLVSVSWAADRTDFYLLVVSDAGTSVVSFRFGAVLEGLEVLPAALTLYVSEAALEDDAEPALQPASKLQIGNTGAVSRNWTVEVVARNTPEERPAISVSPSSGSTLAGALSEVSVAVSNAKLVLKGSGNYDVVVRSGDRFLMVPVTIEILSLPEIAISEPPQSATSRPEIIPLAVLDFGREEIQKQFWIANIGPRNSRLYFRVRHDDQGVDNPVLAAVNPLVGGANGEDGNAQDFFYPPSSNILIDGVPITVTIDRNNLVNDVEFRTVTVEALDKDPAINPDAGVLDAVPPVTLQIRVERQPLRVEGALNRSRPPFVMRFVFLLRDSLSKVIPTRTTEDRSRINLTISENGQPLQLTESGYYLTGPDNLKVNLIVMLDYTGSMYYAGVNDPINPLRPGEAIEQVKGAVKTFLDDLPPSYRVALMFYNDRQQQNRLIRAFTTDREALKAALDSFSLQATQVGVSDIYDALSDGIGRLVAEDAGDILPFDDADVRAIMFITDGWDNASSIEATTLTSDAHDNKVRLYPLGFSAAGAINSADLLTAAEETGGHLYNARTLADLGRLLGNEKALTLDAAAAGANQVAFRVGNIGAAAVTWQITGANTAPWVTSVSPAQGTVLPGGSTTVTVTVNPGLVASDTLHEAVLRVSSNNGQGTATVRLLTRGAPPVTETLEVEVRDDPGTVWGELQNQLVLTYITPKQRDFSYSILFKYTQDNGRAISGFFEDDATAFVGDIRAGQVSLSTTGLYMQPNNPDPDDAMRAEIYLRADYAPRDVNIFQVRFFLKTPDDVPQAARNALAADARMEVELAPDGLLVPQGVSGPGWRLLSQGDGVYTVLTSRENALPYGAFGNLLKITITGLRSFVEAFDDEFRQPEFLVEMRLDNEVYVAPASPGRVSETKYFLYPAGPAYPGRQLRVSSGSDLAGPSRTIAGLSGLPFDPEAPGAWDRDEDGLADFLDPFPETKGLPGLLTIPNPLDIPAASNTATLTIRNNRLDTFAWFLDPASLPDWVAGLSYGNPPSGTARSPLAPGESETVTLQIDRTGLTPGTRVQAVLVLQTDTFGQEEIPTTLTVGAK